MAERPLRCHLRIGSAARILCRGTADPRGTALPADHAGPTESTAQPRQAT